jgi:hypothetical protein
MPFVCVICWQEARFATTHLIAHGYKPPENSKTTDWTYDVYRVATAWVKTPEDLIRYLRLGRDDAKFIRNVVVGQFKLNAAAQLITYGGGAEIHWEWRDHRVQLRYW